MLDNGNESVQDLTFWKIGPGSKVNSVHSIFFPSQSGVLVAPCKNPSSTHVIPSLLQLASYCFTGFCGKTRIGSRSLGLFQDWKDSFFVAPGSHPKGYTGGPWVKQSRHRISKKHLLLGSQTDWLCTISSAPWAETRHVVSVLVQLHFYPQAKCHVLFSKEFSALCNLCNSKLFWRKSRGEITLHVQPSAC